MFHRNLPPVDGDGAFEQRRLAGMERIDRLPADPDLVGDRQLGESFRRIVMGPARDIGADDHAARAVVIAAWVEDILVQSVGPGDAAVDTVGLPEAR